MIRPGRLGPRPTTPPEGDASWTTGPLTDETVATAARRPGDVRLTTRQGHPVTDNQNQRTVGSRAKGQRTPVVIRFSTVIGGRDSSEVARDPRGFAVKFKTEDGNWDLVGNNLPVFFINYPSEGTVREESGPT